MQRRKKLKKQCCSKSCPHVRNLCVKTLRKRPTGNYYEIKMKLEQISLHKTEGAMIRSKARWCEQGKRSTRYFFILEKRNHSNKYITKLRVENRTLTSRDEILNEEHRYYKRLHTSRTNPNDPRFGVFFDSSTLPKPSPP